MQVPWRQVQEVISAEYYLYVTMKTRHMSENQMLYCNTRNFLLLSSWFFRFYMIKRGVTQIFLTITNSFFRNFHIELYECKLCILYIITVSKTLLQLHNRRENQSEDPAGNCLGIRALSLVLIQILSFRLIPNQNLKLISH